MPAPSTPVTGLSCSGAENICADNRRLGTTPLVDIRLADGRLLLACNPQDSNRNKLTLWVSGDSGATWREARVLEQSASGDDEFSYPALLQDRDGRIHVAYTWKRLGIKHVVLTPAVLNLASGGRP